MGAPRGVRLRKGEKMNGKKAKAPTRRHAIAEMLFKGVANRDQHKGALANEDARRATDSAKTAKLRALREARQAAKAEPPKRTKD
jgi:hypothetical protein